MAKQIPFYYPPNTNGVFNAESHTDGVHISWQEGPVRPDGKLNGATVEGVLRACVQRLNALDTQVTCIENTQAIIAINGAIGHLEARTADRHRRGVLGTSLP